MGMIYKKMIKTASTTSTKEYSFELAKSTIVGTTFDPPPVEYGVKNACLLFCFVLAFLLQKAEMQRLFTVKTLPKTNFAQTMSSASNFSRATNQTTSLYVENNF